MPESSHRLYVKGTHLSYMRSKRQVNPNKSLIKIAGCDSLEDSKFYHGKKIAYVYKAKTPNSSGSKVRCIWGKVVKSHGNSGVVKAKFKHNLPPQTFGASVRVMLYPSNI